MLKLKLQYLATWCEELTHWKRSWCWERLKAGEGDNRGWDGWMASLINGHEFEEAQGVGDGQGGLACCSPWGCKESDVTEWLNWTDRPYNCEYSQGNWEYVKVSSPEKSGTLQTGDYDFVLLDSWLLRCLVQRLPCIARLSLSCLALLQLQPTSFGGRWFALHPLPVSRCYTGLILSRAAGFLWPLSGQGWAGAGGNTVPSGRVGVRWVAEWGGLLEAYRLGSDTHLGSPPISTA